MKRPLLIVLSILILFSTQFVYVENTYAHNLIQAQEIVPLDAAYSYDEMVEDIIQLQEVHPDTITVKSIGKTKYGRELWAVKVGRGDKCVLIDGTIHAREWIATIIIMKMIETYAREYENSSFKYEGKTVKEILDDTSIWFVPMLNPDGVDLQQQGLQAFPFEEHQKFIDMNRGREDFTSWKANTDGIDLNRQFPVGWEKATKSKDRNPTYQFYKGDKPLEALEIVHFVKFVKEIDPEISISYHSSGQVLFWFYLLDTQQLKKSTYQLAEKISAETGYLIAPETDNTYTAVYRDWFSVNFERPSITIEVGQYAAEAAVPIAEIPIEWEKNKDVGLLVALAGSQLGGQRIQPMYGYLELQEPLFLYYAPNDASKSLKLLKTQQVIVQERRGDYFSVKTQYGDMWVKTDRFTYTEIDRFSIWMRELVRSIIEIIIRQR